MCQLKHSTQKHHWCHPTKTKHFNHHLGLLSFFAVFITILKISIFGQFLIFSPAQAATEAKNTINTTKLFELTNQARLKKQLSALKPNKELTSAAEAKANDLIKQNYFRHTTPQGKQFYKWIEESGYNYFSAGENLALDFTSNESIIKAWLKSPKHRENLLHPEYQEMGLAVKQGLIAGHQTTIVVQLFGQPYQATTPQTSATKVNSTLSAPAAKPLISLSLTNYLLAISILGLFYLTGRRHYHLKNLNQQLA